MTDVPIRRGRDTRGAWSEGRKAMWGHSEKLAISKPERGHDRKQPC